MKTLVSVYDEKNYLYAYEPIFNGESAFDRVCSWINSISKKNNCGQVDTVVVFASKENEMKIRESVKKLNMTVEVLSDDFSSVEKFLSTLASKAQGYDNVIHVRSSCPFYDAELTEEIYSLHTKSASEYTFADGWPEGLSPCVINTETVAILSSLVQKDSIKKESKVTKDVFFDVMKNDINSFEIETVMASEDMRMYRLDFSCHNKEKMLACKNLFDLVMSKTASEKDFFADNLSSKAIFSSAVLRTVPCFYNIQISATCAGTCACCPYPKAYKEKYGHELSKAVLENPSCFMSLDKIKNLALQMSELSEQAVVSLSLWGEALCHPEIDECISSVLKYPGLSVLIETDGNALSEEMAQKIAAVTQNCEPRTNGYPPIMWIVSLDAMDDNMYQKMHGNGSDNQISFNKACQSIEILKKYFTDSVYTQFLRTKINEEQLENFYHSNKNSGMIIQKYDDFAGLLPDNKVVDLSPVIRNPCWHQRRDMTILFDGNVPCCREFILDGVVGNVFSESLVSVWKKGKDMVYTDKCRSCDEYYTFNF